MSIEKIASDLGNEEPWIAHNRLGPDMYAKPKNVGREKTTLAAKQALLYHVLETFIGPLTGKRILDIGSNQGYTSLEGLMRGANVESIEPYEPNRKKTELTFRANGFLGNRANVHDDLMENISVEKYGHFDAVMFLGTIYHAEHPYEILKKLSEMTNVVVIESQVCFDHEVNDRANGYAFKAFEEGPGSELDDQNKNYLRQVRRCVVRVPTQNTLWQMCCDAGYNLVMRIYPHENSSGNLSGLYYRDRGILMIALKKEIAPTLFDF